jgi:hypothetical protein
MIKLLNKLYTPDHYVEILRWNFVRGRWRRIVPGPCGGHSLSCDCGLCKV